MDKRLQGSLLRLFLGCCAGLLAACNLTSAPGETATPAIEQVDVSPTPGTSVTSAPTVRMTATSATHIALPTNPSPTSDLPATPRSAVILRPEAGSTVSGSPLELSGTVFGLAENRFTLELVDASGSVINRQEITLRNPSGAVEVPWSAALITAYSGPAEIRLVARNRSGREFIAASVSIVVSPRSVEAQVERTSSPVVMINVPAAGAALSGDVIEVSGTAGGLPDGTFLLDLRSPMGATLNRQMISLSASDPALVVPWSASLTAAGYRGDVEIVAAYVRASDSVSITLASVPIILR